MEQPAGNVEGKLAFSEVMTVHDLAIYLKMSDVKIYRMARPESFRLSV